MHDICIRKIKDGVRLFGVGLELSSCVLEEDGDTENRCSISWIWMMLAMHLDIPSTTRNLLIVRDFKWCLAFNRIFTS